MQSEHQLPIWFFIGVLLLFYGVIITLSGIYQWVDPPQAAQQVRLATIHADIWWGAFIAVVGAIYTWKYNPAKA